MNARDLRASLRRRWALVLVALMVSLGVAQLAVRAIQPEYEVKASVVLVPPKSTEDPTANRYLALSNLSQASSVVMRALNSDETHAVVDPADGSGSYVVEPDFTTSAPILVVTATSHSARVSNEILDRTVQQVPLVLDDLQQRINIGKDSAIVSTELTRDAEPTVLQKARIRAGIAIGTGMLALLLLAIGGLDGIMVRRGGGSPSPSGEQGGNDGDDDGDDDKDGQAGKPDAAVSDLTKESARRSAAARLVADRDLSRRRPVREMAVAKKKGLAAALDLMPAEEPTVDEPIAAGTGEEQVRERRRFVGGKR